MGVIGTAAALLLSAGVVFAEEGQVTTATREGKKIEVRAINATTTRVAEFEKTRATASSTASRLKAVREEVQVKETSKREKAERRLADIQDKQKKQLAEKMAKQFENLNTTWTDKFTHQLDTYGKIVQKMQSRADIAAAAGKDVTAATTAIQAALTSIAAANTAVIAQATKTYTLDTSTIVTTTATTTPKHQEELMKGLRSAFQNLHAALFKDLFALRDGPMTDARKAVQSALQSLGKVPKVDDDRNATSTEKTNQ